jgi:hypothetical protein
MKTTLGLIENVWLKDTPYLTGNEITIADLLGVCEIEQASKFLNYIYFSCLMCLIMWVNSFNMHVLSLMPVLKEILPAISSPSLLKSIPYEYSLTFLRYIQISSYLHLPL